MASAPERSCVVCRTRYPLAELQRWVVTNGVVVADTEGKQPGRGYYSCASCAAKAPMVIAGRHTARIKQLAKVKTKRGA